MTGWQLVKRQGQAQRRLGPAALVLPLLLFAVDGAADVDRWRSIDGRDNSVRHPMMGAAETPLVRLAGHMYGDFISTPAGGNRPSAREISNDVSDQSATGNPGTNDRGSVGQPRVLAAPGSEL